jgi:hypothetical protein
VTGARFRAAALALAVVAFGALLPGCAQHARVICEPVELAYKGDAAGAVQALDRTAVAESPRDAFLYHAMRGQLLQMAGDFAGSNLEFEAAAATADALAPWSVTETLTDYTVNDAVKAYAGEDYERAYLHYYMARNYLALDDTEGALVELRRLDEVFRKLDARYEDDRRYQDDGFIRYLSGLIYESAGLLDDARVDYKLALAAYDSGGGLILGVPPPRGLVGSLARLEEGGRGATEIVVVIESGWAPYKREESVEVPVYAPLVPEGLRGASGLAALVKIAYPEYVSVGAWGGEFAAGAGAGGCAGDGAIRAGGELAQDLDALAREALDRRLPAAQLRSTMRATAKQLALMKAKHEGEENRGERADGDDGFWSWLLRAIFEDIATTAVAETEQADTRSWIMLPAAMWIVRIPVEPGSYEVCALDAGGAAAGGRPGAGTPVPLGRVTVPPGGKAFRFCRMFGGPHPVACGR